MGLAVVLVLLLGSGSWASDASGRVAGLDSGLDPGGRLKARIGVVVASERRLGFSGAVLVARNGRTIFSRGVGLADRAKPIRVTLRTVFDIGSITKNLTLAAALALVDAGRLNLSDRLGELLPAVPADKQSITLRQLLEHRAGLPEYVVDAPGATSSSCPATKPSPASWAGRSASSRAPTTATPTPATPSPRR